MELSKLPFGVHLSLKRVVRWVKEGSLSAEYGVGYKEGIEIMHKELMTLQAKCDRYEAALNDIANGKIVAVMIAAKALSEGEGKNPVKEIEYMPILTAELREKEYADMNDVPLRVPMHLLNEVQAGSNHGQTLARLKERGGISIREALSLITCRRWSYYRGLPAKEAVAMLNDLINQKEDQP